MVGLFWAGMLGQVPVGFEQMLDWDRLPELHTDVRWVYATSYDRTGGNADWDNFITEPLCDDNGQPVYCPGQTVVQMEAEGPGQITRIWNPREAGDGPIEIRVYLDGETSPTIDTTLGEFYGLTGGGYQQFVAPFVQVSGGGASAYFPIPFQTSVRVETDYVEGSYPVQRNYYHIEAALFQPGTTVETYDGTLTPEQQAQCDQVADLLDNAGANPGSTGASVTTLANVVVGSGQALTLLQLDQAGVIREIHLTPTSPSDIQIDSTRLRVTWDGAGEPAIDVSLGEFFGVGRERVSYASLPVGADAGDNWYSYWPMPFRHAATVELVNNSAEDLALAEARVRYDLQGVSIDQGYLHAEHRAQNVATGTEVDFLEADGVGHVVGLRLYVDGGAWGILEGDDIITIDGVTFNGTGVEDIFDGGYYYRDHDAAGWHILAPFDDPYAGVTRRDETAKIASQYRWYVANPLRFNAELDYDLEAYYGGLFESTILYYLYKPPAFGDSDDDGDVDLADFFSFQVCFTGPSAGVLPVTCLPMDSDSDSDVDLQDFFAFQVAFTGPG